MLFCNGTIFNGFHPLFFTLFTFVHLYFAQQNVQAYSALAYRKDSFFQSVKERVSRRLNLPILLESVQSEPKVGVANCNPIGLERQNF